MQNSTSGPGFRGLAGTRVQSKGADLGWKLTLQVTGRSGGASQVTEGTDVRREECDSPGKKLAF